MATFLHWVSVGALPLASAIAGFLVVNGLDVRGTEKSTAVDGRTLLICGLVVVVCSLRLAGEPVIDPLWLQYVLLVLAAFVAGGATRYLLGRLSAQDGA